MTSTSSASVVPITVENVEKAIFQIYMDPDVNNKRLADQWLRNVQQSPDAWNIAFSLLNNDKSNQVQFFGACMLHYKLSNNWNEISQSEGVSGLCHEILQRVLQFSTNRDKVVLTKLCLTLSKLVIKAMPESWPDPLNDVINTLTKSDLPAECTQISLLQFLALLPEEFEVAVMKRMDRVRLRQYFNSNANQVLPLLQQLMQQSVSKNVQELILKAFANWTSFDTHINELHTMLELIFQCVHDNMLFDPAIEALTKIVGQPSTYDYPETLRRFFFPKVAQLNDMLNKAVQTGDMEICYGICQLVVTCGENHTKTLLYSETNEQTHTSQILVNMILTCSSVPGHFPTDEKFSNYPFNFWYIFQDEMLTADSSDIQTFLNLYYPIYMKLIGALLCKARYPDDTEYTSWTAEEMEDFRCYRQDIADTLVYIFNLLKDKLITYLYQMYIQVLQSQNSTWQTIEALLLAFRALGESQCIGDHECIPALLSTLGQIPMVNTKLAETALHMLGGFCEWLYGHPEIISVVVPMILLGYSKPDLSTAATFAMKDICMECSTHMSPYIDIILQTTQSAIQSQTLKARECSRAMHSVGKILSVIEPTDILRKLEIVLGPHIEKLDQLSIQPPSSSVKPVLMLKLDLLVSICTSLDLTNLNTDSDTEISIRKPPLPAEQQPLLIILKQILPLIEKLSSLWIHDVDIIRIIFELLDRSLKTLADDISSILDRIVQLITNIYITNPQTTVFDLIQNLTKLFGGDETYSHIISTLFTHVTHRTVSLLQGNARDNTDFIECYLKYSSYVIDRKIAVFISSDIDLDPVFQCGIVGLQLPEPHTFIAAGSFFCTVIKRSSERETLRIIVHKHIHKLMDIVLKGIGGEVVRQLVNVLALILFDLNKYDTEIFTKILHEMLYVENYPSHMATRKDKDIFIKNLLREKVNASRVRKTVSDFSLLCRGLQGCRYASDTD